MYFLILNKYNLFSKEIRKRVSKNYNSFINILVSLLVALKFNILLIEECQYPWNYYFYFLTTFFIIELGHVGIRIYDKRRIFCFNENVALKLIFGVSFTFELYLLKTYDFTKEKSLIYLLLNII